MYKEVTENFTYHYEGYYWECPEGKHITFRKQRIENGTLKDFYLTTRFRNANKYRKLGLICIQLK